MSFQYADIWWDGDELRLTTFDSLRSFQDHRPDERILSYLQGHWGWSYLVGPGGLHRPSRAQLKLALAAAGISVDLPDSLWSYP